MNKIFNIIRTNHNKVMLILIVLISLFGNLLIYSVFYHKRNLNIEVTAHRGYSSNYPENTLLAFEKAIENNVDEIELDVRLSKDDKVIVIHDSNLNRVAKVNKYVSNIKYKEIKEYDLGNGQIVPLLEDVLALIQYKDIKVNIELKSIDKNEQLVQQTIDLINKYDVKEKCYFSSFEYSMLLKVKEIDESFKTLFISNTSDNILSYEVDGYSLNFKCVDINVVKQLHNNKKEVHVWTVNDEDDINNMVKMGVDNIITNDILLTKKIIENK